MKRHHYILSLSLLVLAALASFTWHAVTKTTPLARALSNQATLSLSPGGGNFTTGQSFSVAINVSLDNQYNAANTDVYYNSSRFQFLGASYGGEFNGNGSTGGGTNGFGAYVSVGNNKTGAALSGTHRLATLSFKAISAGSAYLNFANARVVNYPTAEYSVSAQNSAYGVNNPAPPPATSPPASTPPPAATGGSSTPAATTAPAKTSAPATKSASKTVVPLTTQSAASKTGLQITDVAVSEQNYKSALVTWKTNKPVNSKINYSTNQSDLFNEQKDDKAVTDHSMRLEGGTVQAGTHYFFRITADDGSGAVTVDNEFDTKAISVIIKLTDSNNQPVEGANVAVNDKTGDTDKNGEVTLALPEGDVTIFAGKGDLSNNIDANIEVPQDESNPQRISLNLTKAVAQTKTVAPKKKSPLGSILLTILVILLLAIGGFILWRRRQMKVQSGYSGDPLEAENYTAPALPSTPETTLPEQPAISPDTEVTAPVLPTPAAPPEPAYLPVEDPQLPHHTTLPELVGRYGQTPGDQPPAAAEPTSPTGQPIPHHTSLKDMVQVAPSHQIDTDAPPVNDLPTSPIMAQPPVSPDPGAPSSEPTTPQPPVAPEDHDSSLTISH